MTVRVSGVNVDPFDRDKTIQIPLLKHIGRIIIHKPNVERSVAEKCLMTEGIGFESLIILPSKDYSQRPEQYAGSLTSIWQQGEEFINLEHDVAPWPGALKQLFECEQLWCCFCYPTAAGKVTNPGIGCMKFSKRLIHAIPNSWENWGNLPWWDLDAGIIDDVKRTKLNVHIHTPMVAHARRPAGTTLS